MDEVQDVCRTDQMENRMDIGQEGCRTGGCLRRECRAGPMHDRTDAGQDGCRTD